MKQNNDIEQGYEIAKEIASLMHSQDETSEIHSYPHIKAWIETDEDAQEVIDQFCSAARLKQMSTLFNENSKNNKRELLFNEITKRSKQKILRKNLRIGTLSVACALIALSFLLYYDAPKPTPILQSGSITSESNTSKNVKVPTLTYEDGKSETLCGNKKLTINGKVIATAKENNLNYKEENENSEAVMSTITLPTEQRYNLVLEDGSEILLNAGSRLKFPSKFTGEQRNVELDGEAYFKVAKNGKPFVVTINDVQVKVYGTEFIIDGYSSTIKTTLLEGSVGVTYGTKETRQEIMITPSECICIDCKENTHTVEVIPNITKYRYWIDGYFVLENDKLSNLLYDISKWYGINFTYADKASVEKIINASIRCELPLKEVLVMIERVSGVQFIKTGAYEYRIE